MRTRALLIADLRSMLNRLRPRSDDAAATAATAGTGGMLGAGGVLLLLTITAVLWRIQEGAFHSLSGIFAVASPAERHPGVVPLSYLAGLVVALECVALLAVNLAGAASRSLDPECPEGEGLELLESLPLGLPAIVLGRSFRTVFTDPFGLLLLLPTVGGFLTAMSGWHPATCFLLASLAHVGLRTGTQALALVSLLVAQRVSRGLLRAEAAALTALGLSLAGLHEVMGLDLIGLPGRFRSGATPVEPLADLAGRIGPWLDWTPLAGFFEAGARHDPEGVLLALLGLAMVSLVPLAALALVPPWVLPSMARQVSRRDRPLGGLWDRHWPTTKSPYVLLVLKDLLVAWRAGHAHLPFLLPLGAVGGLVLLFCREHWASLPMDAAAGPALWLGVTLVGVTLFESVDGPEPLALPLSRRSVALVRASLVALLPFLLVEAVRLLHPTAPWSWAAGTRSLLASGILAVLLASLIGWQPGGAAEVFSRGGLALAAFWILGGSSVLRWLRPGPLAGALPELLVVGALATRLLRRRRLFAGDGRATDALVLGGLYFLLLRFVELLLPVVGLAVPRTPHRALIGAVLTTSSALLVGTWSYLSRQHGGKHPLDRVGLPVGRPLFWLVSGAGLSIVLIYGARALQSALVQGVREGAGGEHGLGMGALLLVEPSWAWKALLFFSAAFLGPVGEELYFRGLLLTSLVPRMGRWGGGFVSAALFASFHVAAAAGGSLQATVVNGVILFLLGSVLAALRLVSGSVYPCVVTHVLFNHVQLVGWLLSSEARRVLIG